MSQNRIVATTRGNEVVSDATNVLALEAALRRRSSTTVDLAAAHRLLRAQDFGGEASQHFRLFNLVSSARDTGSGRTEATMLQRHLDYWAMVLQDHDARMTYTVFREGAVAERFRELDLPLPATEQPERTGADYYQELAFKIYVGDSELGDGGLVDWTAKLMSDRKERCLISCLSTERLTYASR